MTSIMLPLILLRLLTLDKFVLSVSDLLDSNTITGLQFGSTKTFLETNGYVNHLAEDILIPGNILYSEDNTLRTTNGQTVQLIISPQKAHTEEWRFLAGFLQTNATTVLVADFVRHCLYTVNRLNYQTSNFVGGFAFAGFKDGYKNFGLFNRPWSVINDVNNLNTVIVTDVANKALRSVSLNTQGVTTLVRDLPDEPFGAFFTSNNDEMIIVLRQSLGRFNVKTLSFRTLISSKRPEGLDGDFAAASFRNAVGILRISDELQLVVDEVSNKIRIVDMKKRTIASICDGTSASIDGPVNACSLNNPIGFLLKSNTLYIGEYQHIRTIQVKRVSHCSNISVNLSDGEQVKCLEIIPGHNKCYPAGIHNYKISDKNCTIVIFVNKDFRSTICPTGVYEVADPKTLKAKVNILDGHDIILPVGQHIYHKRISNSITCNITVYVSDPNLKKRLDIAANYKLSCDLINDFKAIILPVVKGRYRQIQLISSGNCNQSADNDVTMECKNNVLSVFWPTDCVFQSNSAKDQEKVVAAIIEYLQKSKGSILELVIPNHIPPIIEPITNQGGIPATVVLTPLCSGGLKYFNMTQTCL